MVSHCSPAPRAGMLLGEGLELEVVLSFGVFCFVGGLVSSSEFCEVFFLIQSMNQSIFILSGW